jgi:uncharacterized membrane protein
VISVCQLCIGIAQVYSKVSNAPELTETIVGRNVITMLVATFWQIQYGVFYVYLNDNLYYLPVVFLMLSVILLLETSAGSVLQKINKYERSHNQAIVASALDKPRSSEQQN